MVDNKKREIKRIRTIITYNTIREWGDEVKWD